jgi:two-component system nitrogen regulation sensor histidine kinase GlnL
MDADAGQAWAEQLATGLARVDAGLRVAWINPALAELLGVGTRSVVGQLVGAALRAPACAAAAQRAKAQGQGLQLRAVTLGAAGGEDLLVDISVQPCTGGALLEVHALAPEQTAASPLSGTLRGLAHEMKNPLSGMRGAAQLLQRRAADEDARALAALIITEADRLAALADGLLHHDGAPRLAATNIHAVIERALDVVRAAPSAPRLVEDYDPSVPDVLADADRLQQVLLNLLRNVAQAGAATLSVRTRVEHGVRLGERVWPSALRVDVRDDGPGVPDAVRDHLFQPLVSGRADGTGLGLALSRELAREHGGDLRCSSRPGATVFSLYLPLERMHA